jgi:hypothetical protein
MVTSSSASAALATIADGTKEADTAESLGVMTVKGAIIGLTVTVCVSSAGVILSTEPTARTICGGVLIVALVGLCWLAMRTDKGEQRGDC